MKITIDNEEVLCNKNFTINEEMLNTSSVILNNVYPATWEQDKDYVSRFYYPKDYSKCKIFNEIVHPTTREDAEGTSFSINVDTTKQYEIQTLKGQTSQSSTPTPTSPQPINITTGRQVVSVKGKNLYNGGNSITTNGITFTKNSDGTYNITGTSTASARCDNFVVDSGIISGDSYTFWCNQTLPQGVSIQAEAYNDNTWVRHIVGGVLDSSTNTRTGIVNLTGSNRIRFRINVDNGKTINITNLQIQIEKGNKTTYEEYIGNDYEINLGKNLFNIDGTRTSEGITNTTSGTIISVNGTATNTYTSLTFNFTQNIPIGTYTFSIQDKLSTRIGFIPTFSDNTTATYHITANQLSTTFTTTKEIKSYRLYMETINGTTYNLTIKPQLEKGSSASSFTPYKTPIYLGKIGTYQDYIRKGTGSNLLDTSTAQNGYYYDGGGAVSTSGNWYIQQVPVKTNTSYYLSGNNYNNANAFIVLLDSNKNLISKVGNYRDTHLITTTSTTAYIGVSIADYNGTGDMNTIMLNEGSQATLYEPYGYEGQWYIHKEIGRVVLNGSESWEYQYSNGWRTNITNLKQTTNLNQASYLLSNYYKSDTQNAVAGSSYGICNRVNNSQMILKNVDISNVSGLTTWLSSHNVEVYYVLNTPTNTLIEDEEFINQLNTIELLEGLNNVSITSPNLPFIMSLMYNYQEGYTEEDILFCGVVENTGNISLNPRYPHYCNLQVLDFKTFLSEGETLDFVIYDKTILEAINQVIGTISDYGFVLGNVNILHSDDVIGAYSTKDKTAYDVFNYIADITQSRWTTRMIDENTIAIDFYDPNLMPQGTAIEYTQNWYCNNKILDLSFSYSSRDYRNKQVMLSGEVYSNVETTDIIVADGYQTQFNTTGKLGYISSLLLNGTQVSIITKDEYDLGYDADFIYQPGNTFFESVNLVSAGAILTITYYAIIEGREVVLNQNEINRVSEMIDRKGIVARYENRNDATTTSELQMIGQSYIKYKGSPEITLKVESLSNIWNIGERVQFTAPLEELTTEYMVKKKKINYITTQDNVFYTYELSSSFNSETEINYFDNQRSKMMGNIGSGEYISRNIDIENTANVIFYDLEVNEVEISGNSTLQSELQTPLGVE